MHMFAAYRYGLVIYGCILPTVFCHSTESHEYEKIQIMQLLNEPNTG